MGVRKRAKSIRSSRRESRGREPEPTESLSQAPTIRAQSEDPNNRSRRPSDYNAKFMGYSPEGDMIIRLAPSVRIDVFDVPQPRQQSVSFADAPPAIETISPVALDEKTTAREN